MGPLANQNLSVTKGTVYEPLPPPSLSRVWEEWRTTTDRRGACKRKCRPNELNWGAHRSGLFRNNADQGLGKVAIGSSRYNPPRNKRRKGHGGQVQTDTAVNGLAHPGFVNTHTHTHHAEDRRSSSAPTSPWNEFPLVESNLGRTLFSIVQQSPGCRLPLVNPDASRAARPEVIVGRCEFYTFSRIGPRGERTASPPQGTTKATPRGFPQPHPSFLALPCFLPISGTRRFSNSSEPF
ncbi:hypothetical protein BJ322DRAFT_1080532, partial [Thelephora terrestris]